MLYKSGSASWEKENTDLENIAIFSNLWAPLFHFLFNQKDISVEQEKLYEFLPLILDPHIFLDIDSKSWFCCCCLPCDSRSQCTWVLEGIFTFGNNLCSTHCREFLLRHYEDSLTLLELLNYYLIHAMSSSQNNCSLYKWNMLLFFSWTRLLIVPAKRWEKDALSGYIPYCV